MDAKKFGAFIADRRKQQHMTQAELAGLIGVTDKAVSRWERGLGFPDINTMEPLADALGISLLELMRSQVQKNDNEKDPETTGRENLVKDEDQSDTDSRYDRATSGKTYTSAEVTEMMHTMEAIRKQQQHQDKMAGYLAVPVILLVSILSKLSGNASLLGAIFVGFLGAGAAVSGYYLWENRADAESRKIYGFFTLLLTGIFLSVCSLLIPDRFWEHHAQWANIFACLFNLVIIGYMDYHILKNKHKEKRRLFTMILVLGVNILLVVWSLHSFAAKSIEDAMGTSRGDVAEQYATQLLLKDKSLEDDWIVGNSYIQIDLNPDIYRVGFTYYANAEAAKAGNESCYGYDIQVDSDYKITIKDESAAIGADMWMERSGNNESETS